MVHSFNGRGKVVMENGFKSKNFHKKTKEEYEANQAAYIDRQKKNLVMIEEISSYLNDFLSTKSYKVTMKEILSYLNNEKNHSVDETKIVSQLNYLLMDLANARKNKNITGHRINIRIMYIEERLKTAYKQELHEIIDKIMSTYKELFALENDPKA